MKNTAIGLIETKGLVGAIEALDACLKAANVTLVSKQNSTGGLITIIITGDVGSVVAAVEAGGFAAKRIGTVVSSHVIPRLSDDVYPLLNSNIKKGNFIRSPIIEIDGYALDHLEKYKVVELRHIARELEITTLDRSKIKFANKELLITAIEDHLKGGGAL